MSAAREERVAKMIAEAPPSSRKTLREAFFGSASPRAAIKAMCLSCVGYDRSSITNCTGWSCPLWKYRPYQEAGPENETAADSGREVAADEDTTADRDAEHSRDPARGQNGAP